MRASDALSQAMILIVDDQEANVRLLERVLARAGYGNVYSTTDSRRVIAMYSDLDPDLIVLDLLMPHLDGYEVMEELGKRVPDRTYLPILVLTADSTSQARQRALSMGAKDFLTKPFDQDEALLRIRNLLETRSLHLQLQDRKEELEEMVLERTRQLQESLDQLRTTAEQRRALAAKMIEVQRISASVLSEGTTAKVSPVPDGDQ